MSLADFGLKDMQLSENEMPGLMAVREKYGNEKPLSGLKVTGSLHMTIQTAMLIDTLKEVVPIWKKENWSDGTSGWVHPGMEDVSK